MAADLQVTKTILAIDLICIHTCNAHLSFFLVDDSKLVAHVHGVLVELLDPSFSLGDCDSDHLVHMQLFSVHLGNILHVQCVYSCTH